MQASLYHHHKKEPNNTQWQTASWRQLSITYTLKVELSYNLKLTNHNDYITAKANKALHRKTQMSHLTHLSHSGSLHGQKDISYIFLSHFVRVLTHYGSNESNDSFRFFCGFIRHNLQRNPTSIEQQMYFTLVRLILNLGCPARNFIFRNPARNCTITIAYCVNNLQCIGYFLLNKKIDELTSKNGSTENRTRVN